MSDAASIPTTITVHRGSFTLSCDRSLLQRDRVLHAIQTSYWGGRTTAESMARAIQHSLCFGLYDAGVQVGFARAVTDYASFAWMTDVYVDDAYRGQGLGTWMIETLLAHPDLTGLRRVALRTRDAHSLYARFGFTEIVDPDRWMTKA